MTNPQPPTPKSYRMQQLSDFLNLYNHIMGNLPTKLEVEEGFYKWYKEQTRATIKNLGGKVSDKAPIVFGGVVLTPKI